MPTIQIWADNEDMEMLRRLKAFIQHCENKNNEGNGRRINESYIYRQALSRYWDENLKDIRKFEEHDRYR